jgi:hypothetical protein
VNLKNASIFTALALAAAPLLASPDRLTVPLSDPARPAALDAGLVMGSITVVAGKAGEVVIEALGGGGHAALVHRPAIAGRADEREEDRSARSRMRRIPNSSLELSAEEEGNRVKVRANSFARAVELRIAVPPASAIKLSTVNNGELAVEGITGEVELHNTNGDIRVRDVRGPVSATTVNGDVKVIFARQLASAPMAFSTLNGDIDLTLPAAARFDVRLRSDNGEIYSDFDVELAPRQTRVEEDRGKGKYRVSIARELTGKVAGGGPELFLKTFNGDIVLRRDER